MCATWSYKTVRTTHLQDTKWLKVVNGRSSTGAFQLSCVQRKVSAVMIDCVQEFVSCQSFESIVEHVGMGDR